MPKTPVIWTSNHSFKDYTLASTIAVQRNAYIIFGSLPQFFDTMDGVTAWLNGVIMTNRKVKESRHSSLEKSIKASKMGKDLFIFSEGVWNKSPNELMIDLWPGIYRIAKETHSPIIPVVHYLRDKTGTNKNNLIHTVVDDPFLVDNLSEKEALTTIRDRLCTWYYLMMEKYGQSTREEELYGYNSSAEAWENHLEKRVASTSRYDREIELNANYKPKDKIDPIEVWSAVANSINDPNKEYAQKLIKELKRNNFQGRF